MKIKGLLQLFVVVAFLLSASVSRAELIPAVGATGVPVDAELKMIFNEPVRTGEHGIISIIDAKNDKPFAIIDVNSPNVKIEGNIVSLDLNRNFNKTDYYILVSKEAIRDIAGNYYSGISEDNKWYFSTLDGEPEFSLDGLSLVSDAGKVNIGWKVENQNNIIGYELYRTNITEAGISDFILIDSYEFNDELKAMEPDMNYGRIDNDPDLLTGFTYSYKLVSVDSEGVRKVQSVEDVEIMNASMIYLSDISPNPVENHFSFDIELLEAQNITVEILNNSGKLIATPVDNQAYSQGKFNIAVPVDNNKMSSGSYILKVSGADNFRIKKFILSK